MIAPEKWYEYQRNYQKYGLDMSPQEAPGERAKRRERNIRPVQTLTLKGKKTVMAMIFTCAIVMIAVIILAAAASSLKYDINSMMRENHALAGDVKNLQAAAYSANNISNLERKASKELKMKYPGEKDKIYITNLDIPEKGFADIMKIKAYE